MLRGCFDRRAVRVCLSVLEDLTDDASVRAECAEALGYRLQGVSWLVAPAADDGLARRVGEALGQGLGDPSAQVRFWSVYSVGVLGQRQHSSALKRLRDSDREVIPGMWSVAEEAQDVLAVLAGAPWPERVGTPRTDLALAPEQPR
ncbi:MAG: hypothetical protein Q8Q09_17190 [Deltaproteobacteria bacterium]|nr:hypothetical protein [Deltaproteobacteria bacterium]